MMDFLFVILVFLTISFIASYRNKQIDEEIAKRSKMVKCPPHQWAYVKQPGTDHEYMRCLQCGMFPGGRGGGEL